MKLQIDQIDSFDRWLSATEQRIEKNLEILEDTLPGIDRQYQELALLQDELVSQQQITESLQNMVIVIDDGSSNDQQVPSNYSSMEIESKLLNLSERWAQICNFVQNRWIQLQEVKIEFEQIESNREKVDSWLTDQEEQVKQVLSQSSSTDTATLMGQVHAIQVGISARDIASSFVSIIPCSSRRREKFSSRSPQHLCPCSSECSFFFLAVNLFHTVNISV